MIEEAVQDRRGSVERRIGNDSVRRAGEWELERVACEHGDRGCVGEPASEPGRERGFDLERKNPRAARGQRVGKGSRARADLDDEIRGCDVDVGRDAIRERCALEEVLSEIPTV